MQIPRLQTVFPSRPDGVVRIATYERPLKVLGASALAGLVLAGTYALLAPSWYTARISVVSLRHTTSRGLPQQASDLLDLGVSLPGLGSGGADRVAAVLTSESVSNAVIEKFDLRRRYGETYLEGARETLWEHCSVRVVPKGEVVVLTCEDKEPTTAQAMVAFFGDHGNAVFRRVDASSASEEVRFLESHLADVRQQAQNAQQRVREFEEQNRIVDLETQAKAVVSSIASLRSQKVSKELELSYAKGFTARDESGSVQLRRMLEILEEKSRAMAEGAPRSSASAGEPSRRSPLADADLFPAALAVPGLRAQLEQLQLDRKFYEAAALMTMQRLEAAKANEAREVSAFQILDAPTLPSDRTRPKRLLIALLGAAIGLLAGAAWLFGPGYLRSLFETPTPR
jgi:tyrosine-protein kinase Etk/Wzc